MISGTDKLNNLYSLAEEQGYKVDCFHINASPSLSIHENNNYFIAIDPMQLNSHAEELVLLAHETGHCETGSFYNRHSPLDIRSRHEVRADRWAIKKLVPKNELDEAVSKGYKTLWELADYFDVTNQFMEKAIHYYKNISQ